MGCFSSLRLQFRNCPRKIQSTINSRLLSCIIFYLFATNLASVHLVVGQNVLNNNPLFFSFFFLPAHLTGELDPSIDKFSKIEAKLSSDVDNWLCNLYFDSRQLPRYLERQNEYEVQIKFSNELLRLQQRADDDG